MENESFVFYRSFFEAAECLKQNQQGELLMAVADYSLNGIERQVSKPVKPYFTLIKPQLDANLRRRANGQKGAEYGTKGGRPKGKGVTNKNPIGVIEENPIGVTDDETKKTPNVNANANANANVNANEKEKCKKETADAVVNLYHECCPSLPKVSKLNPMRIKLANARLKDYTMDELKAIFIKAENSTFLKEGQGTWNGANFDWILNQTNICKIEDGYYSNGEEKKEEEETRPIVGYILNDEYMMAPCYDKEEYERFMRERYGE